MKRTIKQCLTVAIILGAIGCGEQPEVQGGCVPYDYGWRYQECVDYFEPTGQCIIEKNGERLRLGDDIIKNSPEACKVGTYFWERGIKPPVLVDGGLQ